MDHSEVRHLPKVDHTPAELDEPSKLLLKAADLIEEHGLTKNCRQYGSAMCVYGAIIYAHRGDVDQNAFGPSLEAVRRLERIVGQAPESWSEGWGAANWNNAPERTSEEVVSKLRAVALMPHG